MGHSSLMSNSEAPAPGSVPSDGTGAGTNDDMFGIARWEEEQRRSVEAARTSPPLTLAAQSSQLREAYQEIEKYTVLCERLRGAPWEKIADKIGVNSRVTAMNRYKPLVDSWKASNPDFDGAALDADDDAFARALHRLDAAWERVAHIQRERTVSDSLRVMANLVSNPPVHAGNDADQLEGLAFQAEAACRSPETGKYFFAPHKEPTQERLAREEQAKRICSRCPVLLECREHALTLPEPYGVWGGLTAAERRVVMARRRRHDQDLSERVTRIERQLAQMSGDLA